jgi:hypothetical protein
MKSTGSDIRRWSLRNVGLAILGSVVAVVLGVSPLSPGDTRASTDLPLSSRLVLTVFRLHITGHPGSHKSFWVSYGPLADHWGLLRLHPMGRGTFTVTRHLPAQERTIFVYLAGRGTIWTRGGVAPGSPIVTIRLIGPVSATDLGTAIVQWRAPIG